VSVVDQMLGAIGRTGAQLGLDELSVSRQGVQRGLLLVLTCVVTALLTIDYARAPSDELRPGDVAPRTVKAPFSFTYMDEGRYEAAREEAREASEPVFVHQADLIDARQERVVAAFASARRVLPVVEDGVVPTDAVLEASAEAFQSELPVQVPAEDLRALAQGRYAAPLERLVRDLLDRAMRDRLIIVSRDTLPGDRRPVRVVHLRGVDTSEEQVNDLDRVVLPSRARELVSVAALEAVGDAGPGRDAAATIARALVTANLTYDPLQTAERQERAATGVEAEMHQIKRGAILFRAGDTLDEADMAVYSALQQQQSGQDLWFELAAIGVFLLLTLGSLYHFAATYLPDFSNRMRNVVAASGILMLTALLARVVVASSEGVATLIGYEAEPSSIWLLVPVAGSVMLVRLLMGIGWTVVISGFSAVMCGLMMDLSALHVAFFLVSGLAGAGAVEHTRERIAVLRAGLSIGLVNALLALVIHFVQLFVVESELSLATNMRPVWSMSFAFVGGLAASFLVLGLIPLFELMGFVTDYRLMELANLNHPLLRQLMLRAPGSYHHSVVVGTLAEAGSEAIGANALVAKVASFFHDVGKMVKPQYFVENQRDGVNRHQDIDPYASARIIISHVTDGARMAREHNLPQPILENILMHHGSGILQYFYAHAQQLADEAGEDPDSVDPDAFRYPGPKPSTREAGVIMLADKVEAATRTLANPDESNIRAMINRIVNSVIADGQFSECPLTFEEIHVIAETFVSVLLGIYHQRIEYPQTADVSRGDTVGDKAAARGFPPKRTSITLDLDPGQPVAAGPGNQGNRPTGDTSPPESKPVEPVEPKDVEASAADDFPEDDPSAEVDYEAVDYLPR